MTSVFARNSISNIIVNDTVRVAATRTIAGIVDDEAGERE